MPFDFAKQLAVSKPVVEKVVRWLNQLNTLDWALDCQDKPGCYYLGDILIKPMAGDVEYIELKMETRTSRETPNLAIERYSNTEKKTNGGIWETQARFYAHIYSDGLLVVMNRRLLLDWLIANYDTFRQFQARNKNYTTSGILVRRTEAKEELQTYYREYWIGE